MVVVEVGASTLVRLLGEQIVEQLVDVGRGLRHDEHNDDDQHHPCDVVEVVEVFLR